MEDVLEIEFKEFLTMLENNVDFPVIKLVNHKQVLINNQEQLVGMLKEICVIKKLNVSFIKYFYDDKPSYRMEYGREYI